MKYETPPLFSYAHQPEPSKKYLLYIHKTQDGDRHKFIEIRIYSEIAYIQNKLIKIPCEIVNIYVLLFPPHIKYPLRDTKGRSGNPY